MRDVRIPHRSISTTSPMELIRLSLLVISIFSTFTPPAITLARPAPRIKVLAPEWERDCMAGCLSATDCVLDPDSLLPPPGLEISRIVNISLCPESLLTCIASRSHFNFTSLVAVRRVWTQHRSLSDILPQANTHIAITDVQTLLLGGDIEINPGPAMPNSTSPCPVCDQGLSKKIQNA